MLDLRSKNRSVFAASAAVIVALLLFCFSSVNISAQIKSSSADIDLVNGLQRRRLFDLAKFHCRQILDDRRTPDRLKIDIAVADLKTRTAEATQADPDLRKQFWTETERIGEAHLQRFSASPRAILIKVQQSLVLQAKIEQLRQELQADMAAGDTKDKALSWIRQAVRSFESIDQEIGQLMTIRRRQGDSSDALTSFELRTLRSNVQYQIARCFFNRAMLYEDLKERQNRNDALVQVDDQLQSVLTWTTADQPLWWLVQSDRIAVARTQGRFIDARRMVAKLPDNPASADSKARLQSELILLALDEGNTKQAEKLANTDPLATRSPLLDLTRTKLFVALANDARRSTTQKNQWQNRALELARQIQASHGSYWGRRANLLLMGSVASTDTSSSLDMLVLVATEAQRKEQWDEAIKALDIATATAAKQSNGDIAYKLMYRAAAIQQHRQRFEEAAERFESAAKNFPAQKDAATAHLMACWNRSKTIGNDADKLNQYQQMLEFNIQTWPDSDSADQTRIWLARLFQTQKEWPVAMQYLLDVNPTSPLFAQAIRQLTGCLDVYMGELKSQSQPTKNVTDATIDRLRPIVNDALDTQPDNWTESMCESALLICHLYYLHTVETEFPWSRIIDSVIEIAEMQKFECLQRAKIFRLLTSVYEGKSSSIQKMIEQINPSDSELRLVLSGLRAITSSREHSQGSASRALIGAYRQYEQQIANLPPAQRKFWDVNVVDAYTELGQSDQAIAHVRAAIERDPNDAMLRTNYAELLLASAGESNEMLDAALVEWRKIARQSRANTGLWYQSKYNVALILHRQGKSADALKLLNYLKAVPPGWAKSELADEFEALLIQCRR